MNFNVLLRALFVGFGYDLIIVGFGYDLIIVGFGYDLISGKSLLFFKVYSVYNLSKYDTASYNIHCNFTLDNCFYYVVIMVTTCYGFVFQF